MQKLLTCLLVLLGGALHLAAQVPATGVLGPFAVGERDVTFTDISLNAPAVDARIWYPGTNPGNNVPVANGQFPVIAFGHGFNLNYLDYQDICGHLASWGYIVLSPDVQNGFSVDHEEYARELAAGLNYLQDEGANAASDFFQRTDTMTGVLGHSMGGGASGLVPSIYPTIDAVSGLASAETNPSAIASLGNYSGPYQVISGADDNTAPENTNQTPMYNAALGEKHWLSIVGGAHCKFTDGPTICDFVSSPGSVSRAIQIYLSKKYCTAFFNYYLKADPDARPFLCGDSVLADVNGSVVSFQTNISCTAVSIAPPVAVGLTIFPNPATEQLTVKGAKALQVYNLRGQQRTVPVRADAVRAQVDVSGLAPGIYLLRTASGQQLFRIAR